MTQLVAFQVRLPSLIAEQVRAHCAKVGQRYGECLRLIIVDACNTGLGQNRTERQLARMETDQCFTAVALDALLAGHPDPDMRSRAHAAFVRKTERRRSLEASGEGDEL